MEQPRGGGGDRRAWERDSDDAEQSMQDDDVRFQGRGGGDLPDLSDVLLKGERVNFVARGRVLTSRLPSLARWHVIATDRRLVCLRDRKAGARQQLHVALAHIEHAFQSGLLRSTIIVGTRSGRLRITGMNRIAGAQLVAWLMGPGRRTDAGKRRLPAEQHRLLAPAAPPDDMLLTRIEQLEMDVEQLTRQVRFLEDLLEARQHAASTPPA